MGSTTVGLQDPRPVVLPALTGSLFSVDVECVATGTQHHDRTLAQIGLCDVDGTPVLNIYIKPDVPVVSYLSPITGLSAALIDEKGVPLADALAQLRAALPSNAFLCGQNIAKDIEWLGLKEGTDFVCAIDLAALFRVWTADGRYAYFSQDHTASVWLRGTPYERAHGAAHDALADARMSMALFRSYCQISADPARLAQLQQATLSAPRKPSFAMQNPVFEGVCQGQRRTCRCGGPFFS
jgi:RNA exonuclease 4